jgi:hypothetical protein
MQKPVKLKISGLSGDLREVLNVIEDCLTTTRTSEIIQHEDDVEAHIYVLVLPEVAHS